MESPYNREYLRITIEINYHPSGYTTRCGGAIAKDSEGGVYLFHSGKVNGLSQEEFLNQFLESIVTVGENGDWTKYVNIGLIDNQIADKLARFVYRVHEAKQKNK